MSRLVRPETQLLQISNGDWLLVKKNLNTGERRRVFARQVKSMNVGERIAIDPIQVGRALVIEYLLDWSLTGLPDKDGIESVIPIQGKSADEIGEILDQLDPDSFTEIREAIEAHEAEMEAARDLKKTAKSGENNWSPTMPSVA